MKAKFLYLIGQLACGGSERQLSWLLSSLDQDRFEPVVVVWSYASDDKYVDELRDQGIEIVALPRTASAFSKLRILRRLVKEIRPQIVHSLSFYTNTAAWIASFATRSVAIGSVRSDFFRSRRKTGRVLGYVNSCLPSHQVYNSELSAEEARNCRTYFKPRAITVVRNGLDLSRFSRDHGGNSIESIMQIVGVGSLVSVKRWDKLIACAAILKKRGIRFQLKLAGDGPLREELVSQAAALGLCNEVQFLGQVDDIPSLLASSDVLVHCSDFEGCPNSVMEAMACGLPVIATMAGDASVLIDNGTTGYIVELEDIQGIANALHHLHENPSLAVRMVHESRTKAEREFGFQRMMLGTLQAYRAAGWSE